MYLEFTRTPYPKVKRGQIINWRGEVITTAYALGDVDFSYWDPLAEETFDECFEINIIQTFHDLCFNMCVNAMLAYSIYQII